MYDPLWQAVLPHLSTTRMRADIEEFFELSRWSSYDKITALAQLIETKMEAAGMSDVRLIQAPADGRTSYGGWMMPKAYDVEMARLTVVDAEGVTVVLADYQDNPTSLLLYSLPTPEEGLKAELVVADTIAECQPDKLNGRLVLTSCFGVEFSRAAMGAGALGLVCDGRVERRFFKTGDYLNHTNEWHNYTIAPWDEPNKGFGFSLSPNQGQQLRARLGAGETVRLHAVVKTRHYDGVLPVISGRLPGNGPEEIVITGHYDEFGADDNCSQIAVGLEAVRAIRALVEAGELPPLQRGIRLLFPMEARGFNALVQDGEEIKNFRLGLNIDTVGTDQNAVTSTCCLADSLLAAPSFAEEFLAELLERVAEENPLFRWKRVAADVIDNVFGEPLIGAPTPCIYHYSATHHLPLDTPERINDRMLRDMARVTATYAGFAANAGLKEALWLGELVADHAVQRLEASATRALRQPLDAERFDALLRQTDTICQSYYQRLDSVRWLVPRTENLPAPELVGPLDQELRLLPHELYEELNDLMRERIHGVQGTTKDSIWNRAEDFWQVARPAEGIPIPVSHCVPVKTFRGFITFEDLSAQEREYVTDELSIEMGWSAPGWLQNALMLANGKRTAGEIADLLRQHGNHAPDIEHLGKVFEFLTQRGQVRLRPYLIQAVIRDTLIEAGLKRGDAILGHFSLSRFGYIEGGADALIDTLLDLLGPEGTLMMPTFTFSWLGHQPYNPTETPSRVGAVTDRFWRHPEAQRSLHPTHSFAAIGPLATSLLEGHDHTQPPLGENSPIARLAAANGKILMFARLKSNTSMHVGEYLTGLPFLDLVCPVGQYQYPYGSWRPGVVPRCPWHVNFDAAYETLYARGLIRDVPLGESVIHTMRCQDAIEAQAAVARETPETLIQPGCDCAYCQRLKEYCEAQNTIRAARLKSCYPLPHRLKHH